MVDDLNAEIGEGEDEDDDEEDRFASLKEETDGKQKAPQRSRNSQVEKTKSGEDGAQKLKLSIDEKDDSQDEVRTIEIEDIKPEI